ncbi:alcohol dehydrogenase [Xylaria flabelliformis]|nr:alcohol dehydrogenase [Xylaria flabelliformis]
MSTNTLPQTHKALVQEVYGEPLVLKTVPTPQPPPGAAIIKIIYAPIISYMREVYNGKRKYGYVTPLVPGTSAIGRVAATGPDATLIKEGDLVYFDCTIRGRDDSGALILMGLSMGIGDGSKALMEGEWRDCSFAEYTKVPLENLFRLDEKRLCGSLADGGLGYAPEQLVWILQAMVPFGGLRSIRLQAGETVIVAPATGGFGSAAVVVALGMGARVIAMGRNPEELAKLKALGPRVETVQIVGDVEKEVESLKKFGRIDAFFDISPREAQNSTHFKSAILSLGYEGRVSMMGGFLHDVPIPHRYIMRQDITLKGKWMYSREDCQAFLGLMTTGVLDVRKIVKVVETFKLEEWEKAFDVAAEYGGKLGQLVMFTP